MITAANHSHELIRRSKECVINVPTLDLAEKVVRIGNCSGRDVEKFAEFELTPAKAAKVKVPLIAECFANFECKLVEASLVRRYNFFIFEVVKAHDSTSPKVPRTIHYRGDGQFMTSGKETRRFRRLFRPQNL